MKVQTKNQQKIKSVKLKIFAGFKDKNLLKAF